MPLQHIEHLLLLVEDVDAVADWFVDNIGLERGHTPDFKIPVTWLYIAERDVLHIARIPSEDREKRFNERYLGGRQSDDVSGTGIIDHVAFRCTDLPAMIARLNANGIEFLQRQANAGDLYQLFIKGPLGIRVELNFDGEEARAHGITPDMTASQAVAGT